MRGHLVTLLCVPFFLFACCSVHYNVHINEQPTHFTSAGEALVDTSTAGSQPTPEPGGTMQWVQANSALIAALLAFLCIWALYMLWQREKRRSTTKLSPDDLALIEMARNVMNQLWNRVRPGRNVVRLDEYR